MSKQLDAQIGNALGKITLAAAAALYTPTAAIVDPCELYAAGIDTSDYVSRIAPAIVRMAQPVGDLLDVGAGGGQVGSAVRRPGRRWTAIEPAPSMVRRLLALPDRPEVIATGWEGAPAAQDGHDTVLACNMPAFLDHAPAFLDRCRTWARRNVVWGVGAHRTASGIILAALLPPEWHGEAGRPTIDRVMDQLGPSDRPEAMETVHWTFSQVVDDLERLAIHLGERLGWAANDPRGPELLERLADQARPDPNGWRLDVPRSTTILLWKR